MIELQTNKNKEKFEDYSANIKGINHFCFYVENIEKKYLKIKELGFNSFKTKNGKVIYKVENGQLFKLISPEGTIIEFRDNPGI